jgi:geranylgeranyl reductase family protein
VDVFSAVWDVVVVGAGPSGSMAAYQASLAGCKVLLVDRAEFPRYKRCGGGLTGSALSALPEGFMVPVASTASALSTSFKLGSSRERTAASSFLSLVNRASFDSDLVDFVQTSGVVFKSGLRVTSGIQEGSVVHLSTPEGTISASAVVACDGVNSVLSRLVEPVFSSTDFAVEVEIHVPPGIARSWRGRVHIDFGSVEGGYGWVFPKGDVLTVGVIADSSKASVQGKYLERFLLREGLSEYSRFQQGGHHTRTRAPGSPLSDGRVFLAGDAGGWADSFLREGISYALRSGSLAGRDAVNFVLGEDVSAPIEDSWGVLGEDLAAASLFGSFYVKHPKLVRNSLVLPGPGFNAFQQVSRGETSFARALRRPAVARLVGSLPQTD